MWNSKRSKKQCGVVVQMLKFGLFAIKSLISSMVVNPKVSRNEERLRRARISSFTIDGPTMMSELNL